MTKAAGQAGAIRATLLTAPEAFTTIETAPPAPADDEVLVRVLETGLCGSDVTMYLGKHPVNRPPLTLGHEFHGELQTAPRDGGAHVGDQVAIFPALSCGSCTACQGGANNLCHRMGIVGAQRPGALAGVVCVPAGSVHPIDPAMPRDLRVLIEPLAVALHAVGRAGSVTNQQVAVLGAGTIGVLVGLVLLERGASAVYLVDTDERRVHLAGLAGAGTALLGAGRPLRDVLDDAHGQLDTVFDCVGAPTLAGEAMAAVHAGGTVVLVGVQHGSLDLDGVVLQRGERAVLGVQLYTRHDFEESMRLLTTTRRFRELPTDLLIRRNPVAAVPAVFERLARRGSNHLKEAIVFD